MKLKKQINTREGHNNTVYVPDKTSPNHTYLWIAFIAFLLGIVMNVILKIAL